MATLLAATDWMTECYQSKTNSASFQFAEDADQAPESRFLIAFQSGSSQLFTILSQQTVFSSLLDGFGLRSSPMQKGIKN